jgi:predicted phosphodiesterase
MNCKQTCEYSTLITIFSFLVLVNINNIDVIYAQTTIPNFNIAAVGDWGCNSNTDKTVNSINNQNPELILGLGDYSYESSADCWLDTIEPIYDHNNPNSNKMQITIGNHENSGSEDLNTYLNAFSLTRQFGQVYSFNFNNVVHFLSMATEISYSSSSSQNAFVKQDLDAASKNPNINWIIVYFHKPMYSSPSSCSSCSGESSLRDIYHPLFDKYGVDLVLEGHTHDYQRSFPIKFNSNSKSNPIITDTNRNNYNFPGGHPPSQTHGEIYSLVGTGGINFHSLQSPLKSYLVYGQSKEFGFLNIDIQNNGQTLVGKFLSNDRSPSSPLDQFTITKSGSPPPTSQEICNNGLDDDRDGFKDAEDIDSCPAVSEICNNGLDDDRDGKIDAADPNCQTTTTGYHYEPFLTVNSQTNVVTVPSTQNLQLLKFSVAAWFKTTSNFGDEALIVNKGGKGSDSSGKNMNYGIWMTSSEKVQGGFETSSGTDRLVTSPTSYNNGQWHHGVVTFDGSILRLYVDGVQITTLSTSSTPETTGTNPLKIGANSRIADGLFTGTIDEVGVWNKALNPSEIASLMNNGIANLMSTSNLPTGSVYTNTFG